MTVLENAAKWRPDSGGFVRDDDQEVAGLSKPEPAVDRQRSGDSVAQCEVPRKAFPGAGCLSGPCAMVGSGGFSGEILDHE